MRRLFFCAARACRQRAGARSSGRSAMDAKTRETQAMMRVLVTGATGRTGALALKKLRARPRDFEALGFARAPGKAIELFGTRVAPEVRKAVGSIPWNVTTVKLELEVRGELVRVPERVSPVLEITALADRAVKAGGPALLFEDVEGSELPLVIGLYGTRRRMAWALGLDDLDELTAAARVGRAATEILGRRRRKARVVNAEDELVDAERAQRPGNAGPDARIDGRHAAAQSNPGSGGSSRRGGKGGRPHHPINGVASRRPAPQRSATRAPGRPRCGARHRFTRVHRRPRCGRRWRNCRSTTRCSSRGYAGGG